MEPRIERLTPTWTFSAILLIVCTLAYAGAVAVGVSLALRAIQSLAMTFLSAPRL